MKNTQAKAQLLIKFSYLIDAHFRFTFFLHIFLFFFLFYIATPFPLIAVSLSISAKSSLETFQNVFGLHSGFTLLL